MISLLFAQGTTLQKYQCTGKARSIVETIERGYTLTLHTYTGKNRCARAIAGHLRLCSPQTGLHVQ
jgi:hypothetical protein